jgi:hypothetical protein
MSPAPATSLRRCVLVGLAGSTIEWYDFFIYAAATALVFTKLFFPGADPLAGTLLAFSTFAVGFLMRPIGAAVFGHVGDRIGRKPALVSAMVAMGVATTAIGLLPTYAAVGALGPGAARAAAADPGAGARRPMGRSGAAGHRERSAEPARLLRELRPAGCPAGPDPRERRVPGRCWRARTGRAPSRSTRSSCARSRSSRSGSRPRRTGRPSTSGCRIRRPASDVARWMRNADGQVATTWGSHVVVEGDRRRRRARSKITSVAVAYPWHQVGLWDAGVRPRGARPSGAGGHGSRLRRCPWFGSRWTATGGCRRGG